MLKKNLPQGYVFFLLWSVIAQALGQRFNIRYETISHCYWKIGSKESYNYIFVIRIIEKIKIKMEKRKEILLSQNVGLELQKSRIRETKNLLTDADKRTDPFLERLCDLSHDYLFPKKKLYFYFLLKCLLNVSINF